MPGNKKGNENKKVKKHESRLPKFLSSKSDIFPYTQSSSSEDSGQSDYSDKDKGIKRNRPNDSSQNNNRSLLQPPPSPSTNRGRDTNRILENILPTSYPNKKRRVQGYESGYESDTEYEVNKNNSILHGININNNISESSQEDLFLKFWSNKSEYFPYAQPDSYLNTSTSIKRNRPNDSPQNNNRSLQQTFFYQKNRGMGGFSRENTTTSATFKDTDTSALQKRSADSKSITLTDEDIQYHYPTDYFNIATASMEEIHSQNFLWTGGSLPYQARHGTQFMIKFEAIPKVGTQNAQKRHLGSFKPEAVFIAKGENLLEIRDKKDQNYIPCLRRQANDASYPLLHSEASGLENMTYSTKPHGEISPNSFLYKKINSYQQNLKEGEKLRVKITAANSLWLPCTKCREGEKGITCDSLLKNFVENISKTFGAEARIVVNSNSTLQRKRYGAKPGNKLGGFVPDKKYIAKAKCLTKNTLPS